MAVTAPTPIPAGPPVPNSNDPQATFDAMYEAFNSWERNDLQPGVNALGINVYDNALASEEGARVAELAGDRATTKAAEALTSANNAATSAANANTAKLAAEAALDSFDDRYLGAKSSDPALDNDGNPVIVGALYFRTTAPIGMKVKTASGWDDAYANLASKYDKTGGDINGPVGVVGLLTAKSPSAGVAGKIAFQDSTGVGTNLQIGKNDSFTNWADISHTASGGMLNISQSGAGTVNTLVNNTIIQEVTTAGVRILSGSIGYGTGAGGTATQATSKSTGVTLNKPTGQITTNNASLGAGSIASFTLSNSFIGGNDVLALGVTGGTNPDAYLLRARTFTGGAVISIVNQTAGALSDAVQFQFIVIKGATA